MYCCLKGKILSRYVISDQVNLVVTPLHYQIQRAYTAGRRQNLRAKCLWQPANGMVMYELFAKKIPFSEVEEGVEVVTQIRSGKRPKIPQKVPPHIKQIMESCWKEKPQDRPTFEKILEVGPPHAYCLAF